MPLQQPANDDGRIQPVSKTTKQDKKAEKAEKAPKTKVKRSKRGKGPALIAGAAVGVLGFGAIFVGVQASQPETVDIYRTSNALAANQQVTLGDIEVATVPVGAAPDNALTREDLEARMYFAQVALPEGTPLSSAVVGTKTRTNVVLPPGTVTASFEADPESAVAGNVQPGDYINITALGQNAEGTEVAKTILNRVLVLDVTVNPRSIQKSASSKQVDEDSLAGPNNPAVYGGIPDLYVVAVTNEQAATLALARDKDLYITLTTKDAIDELNVSVSATDVFGNNAVAPGVDVGVDIPTVDEPTTDPVTDPTADTASEPASEPVTTEPSVEPSADETPSSIAVDDGAPTQEPTESAPSSADTTVESDPRG